MVGGDQEGSSGGRDSKKAKARAGGHYLPSPNLTYMEKTSDVAGLAFLAKKKLAEDLA